MTAISPLHHADRGPSEKEGWTPPLTWCLLSVMSLAWGTEGLFWSLSRQGTQLTELGAGLVQGLCDPSAEVVITSDIQQSGLSYHENSFYDWHAQAAGEPPLLHLPWPGQRMTGIKNGASREALAARRQS